MPEAADLTLAQRVLGLVLPLVRPREDVARLGLDEGDALIRIERAPWCVMFFGKDALDG